MAELRRHFWEACTEQDLRNVGNDCVIVLKALSEAVYNPIRHLREGEDVPPVGNRKQRLKRYVQVEMNGAANTELRRLACCIGPTGLSPILSGTEAVTSITTTMKHCPNTRYPPKLWSYLQTDAAKHKAAGNGFGFGLVHPHGTSRTLSARYYKDGSEILLAQESGRPRRLTPRISRLMGFDDSFRIPVSDTQAYKQFGNSVVTPVMREVGRIMTPHVLGIADGTQRSEVA